MFVVNYLASFIRPVETYQSPVFVKEVEPETNIAGKIVLIASDTLDKGTKTVERVIVNSRKMDGADHYYLVGSNNVSDYVRLFGASPVDFDSMDMGTWLRGPEGSNRVLHVCTMQTNDTMTNVVLELLDQARRHLRQEREEQLTVVIHMPLTRVSQLILTKVDSIILGLPIRKASEGDVRRIQKLASRKVDFVPEWRRHIRLFGMFVV